MTERLPRRLSLDECLSGFYAVCIAESFLRGGLLSELKAGCGIDQAAKARGYVSDHLTQLATFVRTTSSILDHDTGDLMHALHQYVGAYGPCLHALDVCLADRLQAAALIDRERHAAAFDAPVEVDQILVALIRDLGFRHVVDLGAGTGQLLHALATQVEHFNGLGIDSNPAMISVAARHRGQLATGARLSFLAGVIPRSLLEMENDDLATVDAILLSQVLNEFFVPRSRALDVLQLIRQVLPGRMLIVSDYYGAIGSGDELTYPRAALHDVAQIASGQGMPPCDFEGWESLYCEAGCRCVGRVDNGGAGVRTFIHLVRL